MNPVKLFYFLKHIFYDSLDDYANFLQYSRQGTAVYTCQGAPWLYNAEPAVEFTMLLNNIFYNSSFVTKRLSERVEARILMSHKGI